MNILQTCCFLDDLDAIALACHRTAKVFVKASAPHGIDGGYAVFGGENEVIVQAQIGGGHWRKLRAVFDETGLRPLRGR